MQFNPAAASGRAYGFFRSRCLEGGIKTALMEIKPTWKPAPEPLIKARNRYSVYDLNDVREGATIIGGDEQQLIPIAQGWMARGANYFLRVSIPGNKTERIVGELQDILVHFYFNGIIEKAGGIVAAAYFMDRSGSYTYRIIGG